MRVRTRAGGYVEVDFQLKTADDVFQRRLVLSPRKTAR
jgi:hypothetical protein